MGPNFGPVAQLASCLFRRSAAKELSHSCRALSSNAFVIRCSSRREHLIEQRRFQRTKVAV